MVIFHCYVSSPEGIACMMIQLTRSMQYGPVWSRLWKWACLLKSFQAIINVGMKPHPPWANMRCCILIETQQNANIINIYIYICACLQNPNSWSLVMIDHPTFAKWQCVKTLYPCSSHQNSWHLWMFIPLKMVLYNRYWSIPKLLFGCQRLLLPGDSIPIWCH